MTAFDLNLDATLKRLSLANTRRTWRELVARAEKEQWSYHDFLATIFTEEVAHRQQTRIQRNAQRSCSHSSRPSTISTSRTRAS